MKFNSPYIGKKCLFNSSFYSGHGQDSRDDTLYQKWNDRMPNFFQRLNKDNNDRSFVILASSVLEKEAAELILLFVPQGEHLMSQCLKTYYARINFLTSFMLLPKHIIDMLNILRVIRNEFAHAPDYDTLELAAQKIERINKQIDKLLEFKKIFPDYMPYYGDGSPLRFLFKDAWSLCLRVMYSYETNVKLVGEEFMNPEFINELARRSEKYRTEADRIFNSR